MEKQQERLIDVQYYQVIKLTNESSFSEIDFIDENGVKKEQDAFSLILLHFSLPRNEHEEKVYINRPAQRHSFH